MLRTSVAVFCIALFFTPSLYSQDANYWSNNYGPGGFFTPGAVIANNKDSGVVSFNPALLAYSNKNTASISANVYEYESIKMKNGVGTGHNLSATSTKIIPLMVSGTIALKLKKPFTIAYALINDPIINYQASQRRDEKFNVLNDSYSPGPEYYVGQYTAQNIITETRGIVGSGFKIAPNLSAGFTIEGMIRKQTHWEDLISRALINGVDSNSVTQSIAGNDISYLATYTSIGAKFKAGLSYDLSKFHLGLIITSPFIRVGGTATIVADQVVSNIKDSYSNYFYSLMSNTRQTGLHAKYRTPFSIGLGLSYDYDHGQVYLAGEYFGKIKQYNIITPRNDYFIRPDTGNNNELTQALLQFKDAHKAVFNAALGISYELRPAVMGFFSLRTDFTYADNDLYTNGSGFTPNVTNWNIYHAQIGINVKKRKFNLRAGLLLSYGRTGKFLQPVNFDNPNEENVLEGNPILTKANSFSAGLMLAYIYNL